MPHLAKQISRTGHSHRRTRANPPIHSEQSHETPALKFLQISRNVLIPLVDIRDGGCQGRGGGALASRYRTESTYVQVKAIGTGALRLWARRLQEAGYRAQ